MNKAQFLTLLESKLDGLPYEDIKQSLEYYSEMIDDRIEDGLSEMLAVDAIGAPADIAKQILMDVPMQKLVMAKAKPKRALRTWEIVLLAAGSPLWLSLAIAAAAVVLAVYIVLGAVIVSLYAVVVSLGICGIAAVAAAVILFVLGKLPQGLALLGAGLVVAGLAILICILFNLIAKYIIILSKKIWFLIKGCFIRKGESVEDC